LLVRGVFLLFAFYKHDKYSQSLKISDWIKSWSLTHQVKEKKRFSEGAAVVAVAAVVVLAVVVALAAVVRVVADLFVEDRAAVAHVVVAHVAAGPAVVGRVVVLVFAAALIVQVKFAVARVDHPAGIDHCFG